MKYKDDIYFTGIITGMGSACDAASCLAEIVAQFDPETLLTRVHEIHKIEHAADVAKHALMEKLVKEFITPIEREDILQLLQQIDDVVDDIEDVVRKLYMYHVTKIRPEMREFVDIILQCCLAAKEALAQMHHFQKSESIKQRIIRVNDLEEMGDRLHFDSIRRLYCDTSIEPLERIQWTEMFDWLEKCCDNVEHVTDTLEMVMLKNS